MSQLIGIFGGTFDPIHLGHLQSIKLLDKELAFDRIHWVLSARPPHKDAVTTTIEHRFAMLEIALKGDQDYYPDDSEISRAEKSYTIDTIRQFKQKFPNDSLCLIVGGDSLQKLHTWSRYEALIDEVNLIAMHRPGYALDVPDYLQGRLVKPDQLSEFNAGKLVLFNQSEFDVSSTELRQALSEDTSTQSSRRLIQQFIAPSVFDYIHQHRLYKNSMNSEQLKQQIIEALEDVKGVDINAINIQEVSDFADYMVVVSGTSDTHVKALARNASDSLRKQGVKPLNENGSDIGEWVLVDFGDVVLHVMRPEVREYYDLEKLWDEDFRNLLKQHRDEQDA
ncbi:UNVERIFIED_CONTAM: hypothetical protein GTU68_016276 [Idotea baltica]|nr:hypothetical protein [Idotea baltica]